MADFEKYISGDDIWIFDFTCVNVKYKELPDNVKQAVWDDAVKTLDEHEIETCKENGIPIDWEGSWYANYPEDVMCYLEGRTFNYGWDRFGKLVFEEYCSEY